MLEFEIGDVVVSIAGRDMGEFYIVREIQDCYAFLVDGKGKTQAKPKKKKLKHIRPTGQKSVALKEKWLSGIKVLDAEIRKTVNSLYKL